MQKKGVKFGTRVCAGPGDRALARPLRSSRNRQRVQAPDQAGRQYLCRPAAHDRYPCGDGLHHVRHRQHAGPQEWAYSRFDHRHPDDDHRHRRPGGRATTAAFGLNTEGLPKDAASVTSLETRAADVNKTDVTRILHSPTNPFYIYRHHHRGDLRLLPGSMLAVAKKKRGSCHVALKTGRATRRSWRWSRWCCASPGILAFEHCCLCGGQQLGPGVKCFNFILISYLAILINVVIHFGTPALYGLNPFTYLKKVLVYPDLRLLLTHQRRDPAHDTDLNS